jgi:hypothetical protein
MGISVQKEVKDYQLPRHNDALQGQPACFIRRLGSTLDQCSSTSTLRCVSKGFKKLPKNNFYSN